MFSLNEQIINTDLSEHCSKKKKSVSLSVQKSIFNSKMIQIQSCNR